MRSVARCHDCGSQGVTGETISYDHERKVWRCKGGCVHTEEGDSVHTLKEADMEIEQQRLLLEELDKKPGVCPECEGERVIMTAPPGAGHADDLSEFCPCSTCKGTGLFPDRICDWQLALAEYAKLREEIGRLEEAGECACEDFQRCILCTKTSVFDQRARSLMTLWGDMWVMQLFTSTAKLEHLAYSLVHDGVEPPRGFGGCSCAVCNALRVRMMEIRFSEANECYKKHYGCDHSGANPYEDCEPK